mmetsp:Transcript_1651/g.3080  ORF Transcript_1651/g.3080 Transcript_1651/m.3080 type:complete len:159 (-) Transcript_1651:101-577(-)
MIMDEDRSGTVSKNEFVNNLYKMKEQDQRTMLMVIKAHIVDVRLKVNHEIKDWLLHLKKGIDEMQSSDTNGMVQQIEKVMTDISANQGKVVANSAPDLAGLQREVERQSEVQEAILNAIQQQTQLFSTPSSISCTQVTKMHPSHSLISLPPSRPSGWH